MASKNPNRRTFVKQAGGAAATVAAVPYFFSTTKTLAEESKSKNDRLRLGLIGAGGMGRGNMHVARQWGDIVAIADVDSDQAALANKELSDGKAKLTGDYREILERDDLDALHIATPDHWHAKPLIEAVRAGHDVYCEKPLTLNIEEGQWVREAVKDSGRIVQVGTQQRSTFDLFTKAIAIVAAGRLGKINSIQAAIGGAFNSPSIPVVDVPANLNWDRWIGPAEMVDYRLKKVMQPVKNPKEGEPTEKEFSYTNGHFEFRWWYDFSGGKLTDWGAHHVDIAAWALEANGQSSVPLSVGGWAKHPVDFKDGKPTVDDRYNTATEFSLRAELPDDVEIIIRHDTDNGVLITGEKGRIFVNRGKLVGQPVDELAENPLPEDAVQKVYGGMPMEHNERKAHWANFFHCVKERQQPISDVDSHMRALNICHLAGISARLDRTIQWDGKAEKIVGDDQASTFLGREYRKGYEIEA